MQCLHEVFQDVFWANLAKKISQALFSDGANLAKTSAPAVGAESLKKTFRFAKLSCFLAGSGSRDETLPATAMQWQTRRFDSRPPQRADDDFAGFVAQRALLGIAAISTKPSL